MTLRCLSQKQLLELAEEVVSRGGVLRFQARGRSMRPAIADQDWVVLGPVGGHEPRLGEVVLARTRRGPRLHRVVEKGAGADGGWLRVRGDTQLGRGETVSMDAVVARLVKVDRSLIRAVLLRVAERARRIGWPRSQVAPAGAQVA